MSREAHENSVAAAASVLQAAVSGTVSDATQRTARIAYLRAVLASGRANGIQTGALQALAGMGVFDSGKAGDT